jgi:hypothetical protein
MALKSIMQLRNIRQFDVDSILLLTITASNDLRNWNNVTSLRGVPWKYYRFRYDFSHMKAADRFTGAVLISQTRRTNKLR